MYVSENPRETSETTYFKGDTQKLLNAIEDDRTKIFCP